MANIEKRGRRYTVRWRDGAGEQHRRTCPDLRTAKRVQREVEQARALGDDWRPRDESTTPDLEMIFQAYLDDRARLLRAATLQQQYIGLRLFLEFLRRRRARGRLLPDLLSQASLAGFYTYMREERQNTELSASQRVRMVHRAWRWAYDAEPFEDVVPRPRLIDLPDAGPELRVVAPTWAQCDRAIEQANGWYARLMTVLRYTGLRKSQAMALRWDDLDVQEALLTVRPELGKSRQERRGRVVPVSPHLIEAVAGWGVREGWLVKTRGPARRVDNPALHRAWRLSGAPREVWRQPCHAFRKAFVTRLVSAGVQEHLVKTLVGHARGVTGDVYTDVAGITDRLREAVALVPAVGAHEPRLAEFKPGRSNL